MARINETFDVYFQAWDVALNAPKTGDSANITMNYSNGGDTVGLPIANSISEITDLPGVYTFLATAAEMNDDSVAFSGASSTANVVIYPVFIETQNVVADLLNEILGSFTTVNTVGKALNDILADTDEIQQVTPATVIATQADVQALGNNTKARISVADPIQIPTSGDLIFPVDFYFYDSAGAGVLTDPDANEVAIQIRAINQALFRTALFDDEGATTGATASTTFTGFWKLNRLGTGRYQTFYKLPSSETADQWQLKFQLEETAVLLEYTQNIGIVVNAAAIELADTTTNRTIIAKSLKVENVGGDADVAGSIYTDLIDPQNQIVAKLPAGTISDLATTTVTGQSSTLGESLELVKAMVNNRQVKDQPAPGDLTLYKDDSTTILTEVKITTTDRTRITP